MGLCMGRSFFIGNSMFHFGGEELNEREFDSPRKKKKAFGPFRPPCIHNV